MKQFAENSDDKALWQDLKAGNRRSFNLLFRKHYSELYYYGIKIFPDPDLVKECIQEVFIRVWETGERLANVENVKSYLIVSVRRMILAQKEKEMGKHHIEIDQAETYSFFFDINEFEKHEEISDQASSFKCHQYINKKTARDDHVVNKKAQTEIHQSEPFLNLKNLPGLFFQRFLFEHFHEISGYN